MACSLPPRQSSAERTLVELLDEKQEPFLLDVYLLENAKSLRNGSNPAAIVCRPATSKPAAGKKNHRKLARQGFRRQIEGLLRSVFALLAVPGKEVKISSSCKKKALDGGVPDSLSSSEAPGMSVALAEEEPNQSSSTSSSAGVNDDMLCCTKVDADRWGECSKQLSPVSVLDLTSEDSDSPTYYEPSKENRTLPAVSSPELQAKGAEVFQQFVGSDGSPEKKKARRTTAQWQLFTPMAMAMAMARRRMKPEDVKMVTLCAKSDFSDAMKRWIQIEAEVAEIGAEIAAAIYDDIKEGVVSDIFTISCTLKEV